MKRDWLTLAFGVALVGIVVALSVRLNTTRTEVRLEAEAPIPPAPAAPTPAQPPPQRAAAASPRVAPTGRPKPRSAPSVPPAAAMTAATSSVSAPAPPIIASSPLVAIAEPARVNASIPVAHLHAIGSCQGLLTATARGLSYETSNETDAFLLPFSDIDQFDVDYLKKKLRVRKRGGRTWNFTNDNADGLFVFHRDVAKTRDKLASDR